MEKALFILGPTGVGKSEMAIRLAKEFDGEIISADSVQIFNGFDIGSAKITKQEMQGVVHHAIDICEPNQEFSVYDYVCLTRSLIADINKRGHLPIIVGGTGLYVKALLEGYNFGDANKHEDFRNELELYALAHGNLALWQKLESLDKAMAEKISPNNVKRIIRAIEIKTFGNSQTKVKTDIDFKAFALILDRQKLYERINKRVDIMIKCGLVKEVENLLNSGINENAQPMQAIGYKEIVAFIKGKTDLQTAIELVKQHSRNYAKRQFTFLRGMSQVQMLDVEKADAFEAIKEEVENWSEK